MEEEPGERILETRGVIVLVYVYIFICSHRCPCLVDAPGHLLILQGFTSQMNPAGRRDQGTDGAVPRALPSSLLPAGDTLLSERSDWAGEGVLEERPMEPVGVL